MDSKKTGKLPQSILISGCLAASLLPIGALGTKYGLWVFTTGFLFLATGVVLATICCLLGVISVIFRRKLNSDDQVGIYIGIAVSFCVLTFFGFQFYLAVSFPPINDVTSNPLDPPQFEVANVDKFLSRGSIDGSLREYGDVKTLSSSLALTEAFDVALEIANARGWEILLSNRDKGSIEITDTTFWFGFKDDVVIRIQPGEPGSRIDLRSVSRVGQSDLGTNSRRILRFFEDFVELTKNREKHLN